MDTVFISDDALLLGFVLRDSTALRFSVRKRDGAELAALDSSATGFSLREPTALKDLSAIALQHAGAGEVRTVLVLQLSIGGTAMPLDVPVALKPGGASSALQDVIKFGAAAAQKDLIDHLEANRLHYSQAVFRSLDAATLAAILAGFTYRGIPVSQLVDAQPIASTANYLVFKVNVATTGDAEDPRWTAEQEAWRTWLQLRGLDRPAPRSEIIPLPSGGVFAEAVLGRFNSAEKIDLTRFWNWQDSPIPITAPEIAPVQAGSRAQSDEIRPGNLSAPVVTIQNPTSLPDPAGVGAILSAIQQGNMFRDMSGLAQTVALAQASQQASAAGATAAGQQAANTLATVMANNTERMRIAAQMLSGTGGLGGGGGPKPPGKGTVSERGGELNAAQQVGKDVDAGGGDEALSPGKQFRVTQFRQQFAGSGSGGSGAPTQQGNIYIAPEKGFPDSALRFVIDFVDEGGASFRPGDKGATVTASGGQIAWQRPFGFLLIPAAPDVVTIRTARLWNDQTFEYVVTAGVEFGNTGLAAMLGQPGPARRFMTNALTFKMKRKGTIKLRAVIDRKQEIVELPITQNGPTRRQAIDELRKRYATLGIEDSMVETPVIGRDPNRPNIVMFLFLYTTGKISLEPAPG